jgi:hypothetical protein
MELKVIRDVFGENTTTGKLYINDVFECFTLEDKCRGLNSNMPLDEIQRIKVYGKTAIPTGRYEVTTSFSGLFNKTMPLVKNVPGYEYIRIHPGNSEKDTLGCILLGEARSADWVGNSKAAFNRFFPKLQAALKAGVKVYITIE